MEDSQKISAAQTTAGPQATVRFHHISDIMPGPLTTEFKVIVSCKPVNDFSFIVTATHVLLAK